MSLKAVIVYKGKKSQTGKATEKRFPGLDIKEDSNSFDDILNIIEKKQVLAVLPVWNSHEGEIRNAKVLQKVFDEKVKIEELWPFEIAFECLAKQNFTCKTIRKLTSVRVAKPQCSQFLHDTNTYKNFIEQPSTRDAYGLFCTDGKIHAVLIAPKTGDYRRFKTIKQNASNPANFTTFALVGNVPTRHWTGGRWHTLRKNATPKYYDIMGIEMPIPETTLNSQQHQILDDLVKDAKTVDKIPKVVFVFQRANNKCGLLIKTSKESRVISTPIPDDEESRFPDIAVRNNLGETNRMYPFDVIDFVESSFPRSFKKHRLRFIKHVGTKTCFFACPVLGVLIHGFDENLVEKITRKIIGKYFEMINLGTPCTDEQKRFFRRHKENYIRRGLKFIRFVRI